MDNMKKFAMIRKTMLLVKLGAAAVALVIILLALGAGG
jgi:hypothetical protein